MSTTSTSSVQGSTAAFLVVSVVVPEAMMVVSPTVLAVEPVPRALNALKGVTLKGVEVRATEENYPSSKGVRTVGTGKGGGDEVGTGERGRWWLKW